MGLLKGRNKKLSLIPIFITICLDFISIGVILPVLTPLLLNPLNSILPQILGIPERTIILGLLIASFSLASFFGAPLMGAWSDRVGRKTVLRFSLVISALTYLLFALGVSESNIAVLFIGRILGGFAGANVNTCVAAMVDVVHPHKRVRYFGLIGMASFACGYVLGPLIGGYYSNPHIFPFFNTATPFYFISFWSLMNFGLNELLLEETLVKKKNQPIAILESINVFKALNFPGLRIAFLISFLVTFSFNFFDQFFQVFLHLKFNFDTTQIAHMLALLGLTMALSQGIIVRFVPKKFSPSLVLFFCLPLVAVFICTIIVPSNPTGLYYILPLIAIFQGVAWPYSSALLSQLTSEDRQGEVLGINTSLTALAIGLPPLFAGFLGALDYNLPILFGGSIAFIAWLIFIGFYYNTKKLSVSST
jgi:MFS transporter, DHA1 family, tetracycline resistance protein